MILLQSVVRNHLGNDVPNVYDLTRNVSFILQNGHSSVSYSRPLLPNVAEIACIHCKPARPLPKVINQYCFSLIFVVLLINGWIVVVCNSLWNDFR